MIRLQKLLANCGIGSRREIEKWIEEERIKIGKKTAKLGDKASLDDKIYLDGKKLFLQEASDIQVLIYNKQVKELCSRKDKNHSDIVFNNLPKIDVGRWIMIGRLDFNSSGLLLFTNSGELANKLMHPGSNLPRKYLVRTFGSLTESQIKAMTKGIKIEDVTYKASSIKLQSQANRNTWYEVILHQGKNREIRKLFNSQDLKISKLIRVSYGPVSLPKDLLPGQFVYAKSSMVKKLLDV